MDNESKVVNEFVRPDPQPYEGEDVIPSNGPIPEHRADDIQGVIQYKDDPNAPIQEKLPNERDLQEGKITPAAIMTPTTKHDDNPNVTVYENGVTQADIDEGRVSHTAVREVNQHHVRSDKDKDMHDMITHARNKTSLSRLNHAEAMQVFKTLEAEGYTITRKDGKPATEADLRTFAA